jgi:hypothetical protein
MTSQWSLAEKERFPLTKFPLYPTSLTAGIQQVMRRVSHHIREVNKGRENPHAHRNELH